MRTSSVTAFSSIFMLCLVAVDAHAQASLSGRLTAAESPLTDCTVSLYRIEAGQARYVENIVTRTDTGGGYRFASLLPGMYIFLCACGGQRVFQGRLGVQPGENTKDISLADPFSGRWKLNPSKSNMGTFAAVREEVREYQRAGSKITMSWRRIRRDGKQEEGSSDLICDGREHTTSGQQITCRFVGPDTVEGYQKPPLSYYVRKVAGNMLSISTFSDAIHTRLTSTLVFDRAP